MKMNMKIMNMSIPMVYVFLIHIARLENKLISSICLVVVPLVLSSPGTKSLTVPRKKWNNGMVVLLERHGTYRLWMRFHH